MMGGVDEMQVGTDGIRLGQLLKLAGMAETGGAAKAVLEAGEVTVNGRPETRRGAQLKPGDVVAVHGQRVRLT
jgi:ribosome-associated protein